jgi:acyl carrier protein
MLATLGTMAKQRGLSHVALRCIPSNKNRPALDFLEGLREGVKEYLDNGFLVRFAADSAASVSYNPEAGNSHYEFTAGEDALTDSDSNPTSEAQTRTALLSMVPETLYDPELIHKWLSENRARPGSDTALAAPRTPVESKIAEIYSELLGIGLIGLHDGFFDLGGHSLLAMQVLSRASDAFQVELDPTLLFTTNFTVGELANAVLREQVRQVDPQDIAVMLKKLSELTDDEAQKLLDNQAIQSQERENR